MQITYTNPRDILQWARLYQLYRTAFPRSERKPFSMILKAMKRGTSDVWYCAHNGKFVGLAITINGPDAVLLDYLAIHPDCRSAGYGSAILQTLIAHYRPRSLFGEIEATCFRCPDLDTRLRRKRFYLDNGMQEMGVLVSLFGVTMELITAGRRFSFEEYRQFYHDNYSPWAADHIHPVDAEAPSAP